jgi:hypothetical protein
MSRAQCSNVSSAICCFEIGRYFGRYRLRMMRFLILARSETKDFPSFLIAAFSYA